MLVATGNTVAPIKVSAIEGVPTFGGDVLVKPLMKGDEMIVLEIFYGKGVGTALHKHTHESMVYIVKGKAKCTVAGEVFILGPGDSCRHPIGVMHGMEALEDTAIVEIKSPAPDISKFFVTR